LPMKDINQLMILRNFATLQLKGQGWVAASREIAAQWHEKLGGSSEHFACHYQVFEQLPVESRGGSKNATSLLKDEAVKVAARTWLIEKCVRLITPQLFCHALNSQIFPSLNISLKKPLCERTARRWLVVRTCTRG
jgi:hypothetical protein